MGPRPAVLLEPAPNFKDGRQLFLRVLQLAVATTPLPVLPRPYIIGFPTASNRIDGLDSILTSRRSP